MKLLLIVLACLLGTMAHSKQIVLDNQQSQYKLQVTADVTHTEYREEVRDATCSRVVQTGSHEECTDVHGEIICHQIGGGEDCQDIPGERICQTVGGGQSCGLTPTGVQCFDLPSHEECYTGPSRRECSTLPSHEECTQSPGHQQCQSVADYETEYYACTQTVTVPYEVKDAVIINDVTVQVELNQKLPQDLHEVIDLVQTATSLATNSVKSTGKVLVFATQMKNLVSDNGFTKKFETVVSVKLLDRTIAYGAFLVPTGIVKADSSGMMITTGLVLDPKAIHFELKVSTKKEIFLDRPLLESEVSFANSANQTAEIIDFIKLGLNDKLNGKKIQIELKVQSNIPTVNLVNKQDVPANIGQKIELNKRM